MKCKIISFICSILILTGVFVPFSAAAQDAYEAAKPTEVKTARIKKIEGETFNLVRNGNFEVILTNGMPYGFGKITSNGKYMTAVDKEGNKGNFARFTKAKVIYLTTDISGFVPGTTYTLSADVRKISGETSPMIRTIQRDKLGTIIQQNFPNFSSDVTIGGGWKNISHQISLKENCAQLSLWVYGNASDDSGGGEVHFDNIEFRGAATKEYNIGADFRDLIAKDKATREKLAPTPAEILKNGPHDFDPPFAGQAENIVKNGDFNAYTSPKNFTDWGLQSRFSKFLSVSETGGEDKSACLHMEAAANDADFNYPFLSQRIENIVGGAEYQVSYRYKINKDARGARPTLKLEYGMTLPGAPEKYVGPFNLTADGEWHHTSTKIYPDQTVNAVSILMRFFGAEQNEPMDVYVDDLCIRMTAPPSHFAFDTERVFFYPDNIDTTFTCTLNTFYSDIQTNTSVDFELFKGNTVIWESKNNAVTNGEVSAFFPSTEKITEKGVTYVARATLRRQDGTIIEQKGQNLFLYDRPAYLGADGIFRKEGKEVIYPTYAYHVNSADYEKSMEANINMVQIGCWNDGASALAALDDLASRGMYAHVVLYGNVNPSGETAKLGTAADEFNIERTIRVVSAIKDHPAVVDYIVMDEIFLQMSEPQEEMEAAFRLIRSLDPKHPVAVMEAMRYYYREASKFVDLLLIDPYATTASQDVSSALIAARKASDYEKPVYALLAAFKNSPSGIPWMPSPNDIRGNNYMALIKGAAIIGYYSISDCDGNLAPWEASDGGKMWGGMLEFGTKDLKLAYDHYAFDKTPRFNEFIGDEWSKYAENREPDDKYYWYSSWVDGTDIYLVIISTLPEWSAELPDGRENPINIPLESFDGRIRVREYDAVPISGAAEKITGNGTFNITLKGSETVLYKITPKTPVDFSILGATRFEDLDTHNWARRQISYLDSLDIVEGRTEFLYAPDEVMTRAEFIKALVKALQIEGNTLPAGTTFSRADMLSLVDAALLEKGATDREEISVDVRADIEKEVLAGNMDSVGYTVTRAEGAVVLDTVARAFDKNVVCVLDAERNAVTTFNVGESYTVGNGLVAIYKEIDGTTSLVGFYTKNMQFTVENGETVKTFPWTIMDTFCG